MLRADGADCAIDLEVLAGGDEAFLMALREPGIELIATLGLAPMGDGGLAVDDLHGALVWQELFQGIEDFLDPRSQETHGHDDVMPANGMLELVTPLLVFSGDLGGQSVHCLLLIYRGLPQKSVYHYYMIYMYVCQYIKNLLGWTNGCFT
ncbi:MAG: hypothetical protein K0S38_772 [Candidatus Paceibacter sp.]|nr:hypothetical protein [Candidatus Paceibacter sp.]